MFLFYVLIFSKKGDTIQGGTLFKGGHYLGKYGIQNVDETKLESSESHQIRFQAQIGKKVAAILTGGKWKTLIAVEKSHVKHHQRPDLSLQYSLFYRSQKVKNRIQKKVKRIRQ